MPYYKVVLPSSFIATTFNTKPTIGVSGGKAALNCPVDFGGSHGLNGSGPRIARDDQLLVELLNEGDDGYVLPYAHPLKADYWRSSSDEELVDWLEEPFDYDVLRYPALTPDNVKHGAAVDNTKEENSSFDWADEPCDTEFYYFPSAPETLADEDVTAVDMPATDEDDFDWSDEPLESEGDYFPSPNSGSADTYSDVEYSDSESEYDDDEMPLTPLSDSPRLASKPTAKFSVYEDPSRVLVAPLVGPTIVLSAPPPPTLDDLADMALGLFVFQEEEYDEDFLFPYW